MSDDFKIKPATRQGVKPLVGFYGKSGSGKTMSALLFARGLAGPQGRVTLVDSESGRGSIFSDLIPGGYYVLDLDAPFSPDRYAAAFEHAEKNSDVVVFDSMSHEWGGEGGVLDWQDAELDRMAGDNWSKREACKMAAWIKPKMAHKLMVQRLLRSRLPLICCLRGEEKTHIQKGDGKTKVFTDEFSSPLFDPRFIFEMLVNFETVARDGVGGFVIPRKITHPSVAALLPKDGEQIGVKHGEALARWCAAPGAIPKTSSPGGARLPAQAAPDVASPAAGVKAAPRKIEGANVRDVKEHNGGGRIRYGIEFDDGTICGTYDEQIAETAKVLIGNAATAHVEIGANQKIELLKIEPFL